MNKTDYAEYEDTVKKFFEDEGIDNLTSIADEDGDVEPYFSRHLCECCGTTLGGDRLEANGYNPTTEEIQEYIICTDCEYYTEYGKLDDMTMLDIEGEYAR